MLSAITIAAFGGSPRETSSKKEPAGGAGSAADVARALAETPHPAEWGAADGAEVPQATQRSPPSHDSRAPSPPPAGGGPKHISVTPRPVSDTDKSDTDKLIPFGFNRTDYEGLAPELKVKMLEAALEHKQTALELERERNSASAKTDAIVRAPAPRGSKNVYSDMQLKIAALKLHGHTDSSSTFTAYSMTNSEIMGILYPIMSHAREAGTTDMLVPLSKTALVRGLQFQATLPRWAGLTGEALGDDYNTVVSGVHNHAVSMARTPYNSPYAADASTVDASSIIHATLMITTHDSYAGEQAANLLGLESNFAHSLLATYTPGILSALRSHIRLHFAETFKTEDRSDLAFLRANITTVKQLRNTFDDSFGIHSQQVKHFNDALMPGATAHFSKAFQQRIASPNQNLIYDRVSAWYEATYHAQLPLHYMQKTPRPTTDVRKLAESRPAETKAYDRATAHDRATTDTHKTHSHSKSVKPVSFNDLNKHYSTLERPKGTLLTAEDFPKAKDIFSSESDAINWAKTHPFVAYPDEWGTAYPSLGRAFREARSSIAGAPARSGAYPSRR